MAKSNKRKKFLWILAIAVVVLGIGGYFLFKQLNPPQVASENLDSVPDYGACELITTAVIREARLGDQIVRLNEATRIKADGLNGSAADSCKFTFSTNSSTNNSLTVSVYPYSDSKEDFEKEQKTYDWF